MASGMITLFKHNTNPTGYGYGTAPRNTGPTLSQALRPGATTRIKPTFGEEDPGGITGQASPTIGHYMGAIGSILGGISKFQSAQVQADEYQYQGNLAVAEAFRDASIIREEGRSFAASQSLQFIGSGVELTGSALITTAQTIKYAETEAQATEAKGKAQQRLAYKQADVVRNEGRAALAGGIIKGVASFATVGV